MRDTPKKILIVKDLTFILPDDFSGSLADALEEFVKYRELKRANAKLPKNDQDNTFKSLLLEDDEETKACIIYGIFEINKDGEYKLIESSSDDICL